MNQVSERKGEAHDYQNSQSAKNSLQNTQQSNQNANQNTKSDKKNDCCVQVAVRVRPFINKELVDCESSCVKCSKNKITIGIDKDFDFDRVIDQDATQEEVYQQCVNDLLQKSFEGYNATVLAYGQTGSGKTFTMGTSNVSLNDVNDMGILPRVIREIFKIRREKEKSVEMILKLSYFEIYNDNIIDLLDPNTIAGTHAGHNQKKGKAQNNGNNVFIREEQDGSINLYGITEEKVNSPEEMLAALERGGLCRSTSATLMNQTSSRSHAVFTIFLEQHSIEDLYQNDDNQMVAEDTETKVNAEVLINEGFKTSKFHFVDLAGSERIKKTGAVGNTLKEGININMGLLSLGNVISALTEPQKSGAAKKHIPYRDSKLTRILQDSLGGNSNTLMIACVSPAESNFEESLNTLKYASRARRIKNKPVVNRDPQSALISSLKQQIQEAHFEIVKYRQLLSQNNVKIPDNMLNLGQNLQAYQDDNDQKRRTSQDLLMIKQNAGGNAILSMGISNEADMEELKQLRLNQVKLEKKIKELQAENGSLKSHNYKGEIEILTVQRERDEFRLKLEKLIEVAKKKGVFLSSSQVRMEVEVESEKDVIILNANGEPEIKLDSSQKSLIDDYCENMEKLKKEIKKKDLEYRELQIEFDEGIKSSLRDQQMLVEREKKINVLTKNLKNKEIDLKKIKDELLNIKKNAVKLPPKPQTKMQIEKNNTSDNIKKEIVEEDDENNYENNDNPYLQIGAIENEDDDDIDAEELEKIAQDPEYVKMESELKLDENQKKLKLSKVDGSIFEKSEEFRKLNQNQLELQKQLLEKMKEQYHQKINHLESDMKKMENQRDNALQKLSNSNTKEAMAEKQRVIESFKQKVSDMSSTLNEYKKKAREQETLQKTVSSQEKQIQQLGVEINKFKQLKTNLYKEMKKNNEEFEKYKQKKYKDLMQEKKKNLEKEKQIFKLQNQTKKQERLLQKNQEDYKKLIRSRDLIKKIISTSSQSMVTGVRGKMSHQKYPQRKRVESITSTNDESNKMYNTSTSLAHEDSINDCSIDKALDICLCKLIESIEIQLNIEKAEEELKVTFSELEDAQQKFIEFKLNLEKRERAFNEGIVNGKKQEDNVLGQELMEQQQQLLDSQKMELEEMQSRLESLEAKYEFKKEKINKIYVDQRSSNFETLQNELLTSTKFNNLQTQKILVKYLLEKFGSSSAEILRNQEKIETLHLQMDDAQQFINLIQNQKDICQIQMQQQIDSLQQQLQFQIISPKQQPQHCPSDSDSDLNQTHDDFNYNQTNPNLSNIIGDDNSHRFNKNKGSPPKQIASHRYKSMRMAHQAEQSPFKKENKNTEDFAKLQQKQINDLTKQLKQNEVRVKTLQNRNETLQQKYDDLKKAARKDKFIGINKQSVDDDTVGHITQNATTTQIQYSQQSQQSQQSNNIPNLHSLNVGVIPYNQNNLSSGSTPSQSLNNQIVGLNTFQQQIQTLNSQKTNKEIANLQSLKDRRKEVKGKVGESTPQNNLANSNALHQQVGQQQGDQQQQRENQDNRNLKQQYQILDRITNNENVQNNFPSKTKAHSLAQKRNQLKEANQKQIALQSQQLKQNQIQNMQQQSLGNNIQQLDQPRGRTSISNTNRSENNQNLQNISLEFENQNLSKHQDYTLNTSTDNTVQNNNSLVYNQGSPNKIPQFNQQPITVTNNYSPAESEDLIQGSAGQTNRINEISQNNLSNQINVFNFSSEFSLNNVLNNSQNIMSNSVGFNQIGMKNTLDNNPSGTHISGDDAPFPCKYESVGKINDAHTGQVFCVQSHENFLFSTSVRTLKIWDLETLKCISDIQAHTHFVRGLVILEQEKWIATACDKYINIWDMISLQKVCTLTGHNVDIKQLYVDSNHILYSAGKGVNNFGALVTWDIRKQQVIDEREKNQDIFSVLPFNNMIYYASRDHYVRRINMDTNQSIDPFKPPHYDAVTSLAILNGYLVSGSKDHNLKLWNTNPSNTSFKSQTYYSNEQLLCLESNKDRNLLYVGQKDGKIKVVTTQNNKFKDVSDINNGLQSVNCITKIQSSVAENMFACGTSDKIIKIWKPTLESQQNLAQLKNYVNSGHNNTDNWVNNIHNTSIYSQFQNDQNETMEAE